MTEALSSKSFLVNSNHQAQLLPADDVVAVQLMSDLHLEFHFKQHDGETVPGYEAFDITPVAPTLALLGDIGVTVDDGLFSFLEKQLRGFERVLFVMGNHEGYNSSYVSDIYIWHCSEC